MKLSVLIALMLLLLSGVVAAEGSEEESSNEIDDDEEYENSEDEESEMDEYSYHTEGNEEEENEGGEKGDGEQSESNVMEIPPSNSISSYSRVKHDANRPKMIPSKSIIKETFKSRPRYNSPDTAPVEVMLQKEHSVEPTYHHKCPTVPQYKVKKEVRISERQPTPFGTNVHHKKEHHVEYINEPVRPNIPKEIARPQPFRPRPPIQMTTPMPRPAPLPMPRRPQVPRVVPPRPASLGRPLPMPRPVQPQPPRVLPQPPVRRPANFNVRGANRAMGVRIPRPAMSVQTTTPRMLNIRRQPTIMANQGLGLARGRVQGLGLSNQMQGLGFSTQGQGLEFSTGLASGQGGSGLSILGGTATEIPFFGGTTEFTQGGASQFQMPQFSANLQSIEPQFASGGFGTGLALGGGGFGGGGGFQRGGGFGGGGGFQGGQIVNLPLGAQFGGGGSEFATLGGGNPNFLTLGV